MPFRSVEEFLRDKELKAMKDSDKNLFIISFLALGLYTILLYQENDWNKKRVAFMDKKINDALVKTYDLKNIPQDPPPLVKPEFKEINEILEREESEEELENQEYENRY